MKREDGSEHKKALDVMIGMSKALSDWDGSVEQAAEKIKTACQLIEEYRGPERVQRDSDLVKQRDELVAWAKKVKDDPMLTLRVQQVWELNEILARIEAAKSGVTG